MATQKLGENPDQSGGYVERGPRGGAVPRPREVMIDPDDPKLPPTQEPGRTWEHTGAPKP